jgi:hypothetical protein
MFCIEMCRDWKFGIGMIYGGFPVMHYGLVAWSDKWACPHPNPGAKGD